jgi:hypothetical protein
MCFGKEAECGCGRTTYQPTGEHEFVSAAKHRSGFRTMSIIQERFLEHKDIQKVAKIMY